MSAQPLAHPVTEARAYEPIGRAAIRALYRELAAYPKAGLVSLVDSGSHTDMDASTFVRSLLALRSYFGVIATAGGSGVPFCALQALGQDAEARMLAATRGANTHRGAIFSLGLLAAAAGRLLSGGQPLSGRALGETVRKRWGQAILDTREHAPRSHGGLVAERYGEGGARTEAAAGFPHLTVDALCEEIGAEIAIINGPDRFILGGPADILGALERAAFARGASTARRLRVGVASHTSCLATASRDFTLALAQSDLTDPATPVLACISGMPVRDRTAAAETLARQLSCTVDWQACLGTAMEMDCRVVLELGPGCALARMARELPSEIAARSVQEFRSLEGVPEWVAKQVSRV